MPIPNGSDRVQAPRVPEPPGPATGAHRSLLERAKPSELVSGIALHVGGGTLIAGGIGAAIARLAGGAIGRGLAIGAGIGAVLGGLWVAAVLAIAG